VIATVLALYSLWICLALGSVPIILVLINIARHSA